MFELSANSFNSTRSGARPLKSTGIIALVFFDTSFFVFSKSRHKFFLFISTNPTFEPAKIIEFGDATNVKSGTITSSLFFSPNP